ncbi:hypothetical protein HPP92_027183 [Vanilla planifolia]|uniref:Uncharacterized protein n=1 Tax=Vanilla planifolia TaxID=51239 RepID=A0A835U660_VANPL|nr:hypothetical protein HPP92_027183 [Vanilla planifolia]
MRRVSHLKAHLFGKKNGGRNREPTVDHERGVDLLAAHNRLLLIVYHGRTPPISAFATETLTSALSPSPLSAEKEPTFSGLSLSALIHLPLWRFGETWFLVLKKWRGDWRGKAWCVIEMKSANC